MNIQAHDSTGSSPYEFVFGQKPRAILFPSGKTNAPLLEEDTEQDGIHMDGLQGDDHVPQEDGDGEKPEESRDNDRESGIRTRVSQKGNQPAKRGDCKMVPKRQHRTRNVTNSRYELTSTRKHLKVCVVEWAQM